jgi:hypothetical protein
MLSLDAVYRKETKLPWRSLEGHVVIVQLKEESVLSLNGTGAELWDLIDGNHTVRDMARYLTDNFEVDEETALADVRSFVTCLLEKKVICEKNAQDIRR